TAVDDLLFHQHRELGVAGPAWIGRVPEAELSGLADGFGVAAEAHRERDHLLAYERRVLLGLLFDRRVVPPDEFGVLLEERGRPARDGSEVHDAPLGIAAR